MQRRSLHLRIFPGPGTFFKFGCALCSHRLQHQTKWPMSNLTSSEVQDFDDAMLQDAMKATYAARSRPNRAAQVQLGGSVETTQSKIAERLRNLVRTRQPEPEPEPKPEPEPDPEPEPEPEPKPEPEPELEKLEVATGTQIVVAVEEEPESVLDDAVREEMLNTGVIDIMDSTEMEPPVVAECTGLGTILELGSDSDSESDEEEEGEGAELEEKKEAELYEADTECEEFDTHEADGLRKMVLDLWVGLHGKSWSPEPGPHYLLSEVYWAAVHGSRGDEAPLDALQRFMAERGIQHVHKDVLTADDIHACMGRTALLRWTSSSWVDPVATNLSPLSFPWSSTRIIECRMQQHLQQSLSRVVPCYLYQLRNPRAHQRGDLHMLSCSAGRGWKAVWLSNKVRGGAQMGARIVSTSSRTAGREWSISEMCVGWDGIVQAQEILQEAPEGEHVAPTYIAHPRYLELQADVSHSMSMVQMGRGREGRVFVGGVAAHVDEDQLLQETTVLHRGPESLQARLREDLGEEELFELETWIGPHTFVLFESTTLVPVLAYAYASDGNYHEFTALE